MANIAQHSHAQWSSRVGFILAATGSAVGLGNIWKFPYMIGQSGGSAFVLVYLACIFLIGMPILVAEWLLGRRGQKNPVSTLSMLASRHGRSRAWAVFGATGILASFLIVSFYSVIGGWAFAYVGNAASGAFSGMDGDTAGSLFSGMLANPGTLLVWHTAFMALTAGVVAMGVTSGLERAAKLLMPGLFILLLILIGYAMTTGAFARALDFMFTPNWELVTGEVILAALGHAFFTLSLGMGIMMAYGSYLGKEVNLLATARTVVIIDTVVAIGAGLAIFPIVFANHLDPAAGPGLVFVTLPLAFGSLSGGLILGVLFFVLLSFAALTSSISLLEPVVELLEERLGLGRRAATILPALAAWALGIAALLSFNLWADVLILDRNVFDLLDQLTSKFLLPLTGLGIILFAAWRLDMRSITEELGLGPTGAMIWTVLSRYVAPIGVLVVFIGSL